jgi:diguanylate cyclase (GGDEF)-like protein
MLVAVVLLLLAIAGAFSSYAREQERLNRRLSAEARTRAQAIDAYWTRARSLTLLMANNPAFSEVYDDQESSMVEMGGRHNGPAVKQASAALAYLEKLFPHSVGEACFIDRGGAEVARAVKGEVAPAAHLSHDETGAAFFEPAFAVPAGMVFQSQPYRSPDTDEWVVANTVSIASRAHRKAAIVHFELTVDSFRREAKLSDSDFNIAVVDARTGKVLLDGRHRQPAGPRAPLGPVTAGLPAFARGASERGLTKIDDKPGAYSRVPGRANNDNEWIVLASSGTPTASWVDSFGAREIALIVLALILASCSIAMFRASRRELRTAATTDALTGLGNRRQLMHDLEEVVDKSDTEPYTLALYDLDGFKSYNDNFGHPAGDALLARISRSLAHAVRGLGKAYRMGGDEFCVLLPTARANGLEGAIGLALSESGDQFKVTSSYGTVLIPGEAADVDEALRLADQRMYANKRSSRTSAVRQSTDVLMRLLAERDPGLRKHVDGVTELCSQVARRLGVSPDESSVLMTAASLHDIGKAAIPDAILNKPGPLDDDEWAFMRQHTLIGERILAVAPALEDAGRLVRWSHERHDGRGYPDGLAGEDIPLGSKIIAVCDAFDAMTSPRPYRPSPMTDQAAIAELRRSSGTQFDPVVVAAACAAIEQDLDRDGRQGAESATA